jgi:hypothetical protein
MARNAIRAKPLAILKRNNRILSLQFMGNFGIHPFEDQSAKIIPSLMLVTDSKFVPFPIAAQIAVRPMVESVPGPQVSQNETSRHQQDGHDGDRYHHPTQAHPGREAAARLAPGTSRLWIGTVRALDQIELALRVVPGSRGSLASSGTEHGIIAG